MIAQNIGQSTALLAFLLIYLLPCLSVRPIYCLPALPSMSQCMGSQKRSHCMSSHIGSHSTKFWQPSLPACLSACQIYLLPCLPSSSHIYCLVYLLNIFIACLPYPAHHNPWLVTSSHISSHSTKHWQVILPKGQAWLALAWLASVPASQPARYIYCFACLPLHILPTCQTYLLPACLTQHVTMHG